MPRLYQTEFPKGRTPRQYLLPDVPADLWKRIRAKAKREKVSMRYVILSLLSQWLETP